MWDLKIYYEMKLEEGNSMRVPIHMPCKVHTWHKMDP